MIRLFLFAFSALIALAPALAYAHTGHIGDSGPFHGLAHAYFGVQHILAIAALGGITVFVMRKSLLARLSGAAIAGSAVAVLLVI